MRTKVSRNIQGLNFVLIVLIWLSILFFALQVILFRGSEYPLEWTIIFVLINICDLTTTANITLLQWLLKNKCLSLVFQLFL